MTKKDLLNVVKATMVEKGHAMNNAMVKDFVESLEGAIEEVITNGDEVSILGVKFSTKEQKGGERVHTLGANKGQTYVVPDKIVPAVKFMKKKKDELTKIK